MRSGRGRGRGATSAKEDERNRHALLAAAALQDHMARRLKIGPQNAVPSVEPGASMTLAQHLGLVARPPPLLTESEWNEVHLKSRIRQDSEAECPICREEFGTDPQVLLSCSHTFHKSCLRSFERFSRSKVCPLCRAQQYQKKLIRDGAKAFRFKCAVRIQSAWRGYAARKRYKALRRANPPKDERLKRQWAAERLEEDNERMLAEMEDEVGDIDALFAELDASVAESRKAVDAMTRPLAQRLHSQLQAAAEAEAAAASGARRAGNDYSDDVDDGADEYGYGARRSGRDAGAGPSSSRQGAGARGGGAYGGTTASGRHPRGAAGGSGSDDGSSGDGLSDGDYGASYGLSSSRGRSGGQQQRSQQHLFELGSVTVPPRAATSQAPAPAGGSAGAGAAGSGAEGEVDWGAVLSTAKARGERDCAICLGRLNRKGNEGVAWLSCTHCFHIDCIMAFEAFELASGGAITCPCCRQAGYKRRCFS